MALDYQTVADVAKARDVIRKAQEKAGLSYWHELHPGTKGDRSYSVGWGIIYSPQEIRIPPHLDTNKNSYPDKHLPIGVTRHLTGAPRKEYISFIDAGGIERFYLIPKEGIRLKKKGSSYVVANPIPDYSISVDRTLAKKARTDAEELIDYVTTLWNVLYERPPEHERPKREPDIEKMPSKDQKEEWFKFLLAAKYPRFGYGWQLATLTQKIRNKCTKDALAYSIVPVPNTRMDHTEHWGMLEALRQAGRLEEYEGPRKAKRVRRDRAGSGGKR